MATTHNLRLTTPKEYLASEADAEQKHEFVDGHVYLRPDERNLHNMISGNVVAHLFQRLRRQVCRPYSSQTKIHIRYDDHVRFYYPDASVVCRSNPPNDTFQDQPVVVFEVLSVQTRRIDQCEKQDAYLTIPTLRLYGLVDQEMPVVTTYRRGSHGFEREQYEGREAVIPLPELDTELPLAEIYEDVDCIPEQTCDDL